MSSKDDETFLRMYKNLTQQRLPRKYKNNFSIRMFLA